MNRMSILLLASVAPLAISACNQRSNGPSTNAPETSEPATVSAADGLIVNPGFESASKAPWTTNVHANPHAYQFDLVSDVVASGNHAVRIQGDGSEPWGGLMQYLAKPELAGKTVSLSAAVKADNVPGGVQMLAIFRGTTALPFEHTFTDLGASFDWQRIEQTFEVPANTTDIEIGLMQMGAGTLWLDDITLVAR